MTKDEQILKQAELILAGRKREAKLQKACIALNAENQKLGDQLNELKRTKIAAKQEAEAIFNATTGS